MTFYMSTRTVARLKPKSPNLVHKVTFRHADLTVILRSGGLRSRSHGQVVFGCVSSPEDGTFDTIAEEGFSGAT